MVKEDQDQEGQIEKCAQIAQRGPRRPYSQVYKLKKHFHINVNKLVKETKFICLQIGGNLLKIGFVGGFVILAKLYSTHLNLNKVTITEVPICSHKF